MQTSTFGAVANLCVSVAAGTAVVIWPDQVIAKAIFALSLISLAVVALWWFFSHYRLRSPWEGKRSAAASLPGPKADGVEGKRAIAVVPPKPKTNPHDVPKKLAAIDDRILPILREDFPAHVITGRLFQNKWPDYIEAGKRQDFLDAANRYKEETEALLLKLRRVQLDYEHFQDIFAILDNPVAGDLYRAVNDLADATHNLGEPPYSFNLAFFFRPHVEAVRVQVDALAKWAHDTERKVIALRKEIAAS